MLWDSMHPLEFKKLLYLLYSLIRKYLSELLFIFDILDFSLERQLSNLLEIFFRPQNMIAQSQSGTGKTAAFVLAMLSRVDVTKEYPQVLCLSPTYELAIQTGEVAAKMSRFCPEIKIKYAVRGEESNISFSRAI